MAMIPKPQRKPTRTAALARHIDPIEQRLNALERLEYHVLVHLTGTNEDRAEVHKFLVQMREELEAAWYSAETSDDHSDDNDR